jgi:hypothetical protein
MEDGSVHCCNFQLAAEPWRRKGRREIEKKHASRAPQRLPSNADFVVGVRERTRRDHELQNQLGASSHVVPPDEIL